MRAYGAGNQQNGILANIESGGILRQSAQLDGSIANSGRPGSARTPSAGPRSARHARPVSASAPKQPQQTEVILEDRLAPPVAVVPEGITDSLVENVVIISQVNESTNEAQPQLAQSEQQRKVEARPSSPVEYPQEPTDANVNEGIETQNTQATEEDGYP